MATAMTGHACGHGAVRGASPAVAASRVRGAPCLKGPACAMSSGRCTGPAGGWFARRRDMQVRAVQTPSWPDRRRNAKVIGQDDFGLLAKAGDAPGIINGADAWGASIGQGSARPSGSGRRLRVAVDVDEVLARFVYTLNRFCKDAYDMEYAVEDYSVYNFAQVWGCTGDESNTMVHAFFESDHFADGIPPIPGALDVLTRLKEDHDLIIVTSRQHVIQAPTLAWVEEHFPGIFDEVHFGNHFALEGQAKPKSEICRDVGADVLIDDNPGYAVECAQSGINVLLFDWEMGYPWSKTEDGPEHPMIKRVAHWDAVETSLGALSEYLGVAETL